MNKSKVKFKQMMTEAEKTSDFHFAGAKIEIAECLFNMMKQKHLNQTELAKKHGVERAMISRIMSGKLNPTVETLVKIALTMDSFWKFSLVGRTGEDLQPRPKYLSEEGHIAKENTEKNYRASCLSCGSQMGVELWPHRNGHGDMVGLIFLCCHCVKHAPNIKCEFSGIRG